MPYDQIFVLADNMNSKTMILSRLINLRIGNDPPWIGGNIRHFVRTNVSEIR